MTRKQHFDFAIYIALIFVIAATFSVTAWAGDRSSTYIEAQTLPPQLLSAPPAENSPAWRKEISGVEAAQKNISAKDLAALRDEQHLRLELMTSVIGADFTPQRFPKSFTLLDHVFQDTSRISEADKQYWHTRRPYLTDKHVKLLIDPIDSSPAYPSGHTAGSRVLAEVLGLLYPQKLEALRARAADIAQHRIEAGVHYPVDIRAGENLAMLITGALMNNENFQDDLTDARDEIAANGG